MSNRWWWPWNILKYFSRTRHGGLDCPDAVSFKSLLLPRLASWSWMLWRSWLSMLGLLLWSLHRGSCRGKDACQLTSRLYLSMRCEWIFEMLTNYFSQLFHSFGSCDYLIFHRGNAPHQNCHLFGPKQLPYQVGRVWPSRMLTESIFSFLPSTTKN